MGSGEVHYKCSTSSTWWHNVGCGYSYMDLGIALRYVLEALKKPYNSKMYFFGIAALDKFKSRQVSCHTAVDVLFIGYYRFN